MSKTEAEKIYSLQQAVSTSSKSREKGKRKRNWERKMRDEVKVSSRSFTQLRIVERLMAPVTREIRWSVHRTKASDEGRNGRRERKGEWIRTLYNCRTGSWSSSFVSLDLRRIQICRQVMKYVWVLWRERKIRKNQEPTPYDRYRRRREATRA